MKIFNKKLSNKLIYAMICVVLFFLFQFVKLYILTAEAFKEQTSLNLAHLRMELGDLNDSLVEITNSTSDLSEFHNEDYIDWLTLHSVCKSTRSIGKITGRKDLDDLEYFYMDTYFQINGILKDKKIDEKEKQYLEELKAFTSEVLKVYSRCVYGTNISIKDDYFLKENLSSRQVYNIYASFFDKTYQLYMLDKYEYMREYKEYKPNDTSN